MHTGQELLNLQRNPGHGDAVSSVCFNPDGNSIVIATENGALKLWEALPLERLRVLNAGRPETAR